MKPVFLRASYVLLFSFLILAAGKEARAGEMGALKESVQVALDDADATSGLKLSLKVEKGGAYQSVFEEVADLFEAENKFKYNISFLTDKKITGFMYVQVALPEAYLNSLPKGHRVAGFAVTYTDSGKDERDGYELLQVHVDPAKKTATLALPPMIFSDKGSKGAFEATVSFITLPQMSFFL